MFTDGHATALDCQPPETVNLHTCSPREHNTGDGLSACSPTATPHTTALACQTPETVTLHTCSQCEHNTGDGLSHKVMSTDMALSTHAYGSGAQSVNTTPSTAPLQSCIPSVRSKQTCLSKNLAAMTGHTTQLALGPSRGCLLPPTAIG